MKKTLIILAHPDITKSKMNKSLLSTIANESSVTVHDLYATYKTIESIDVAREQKLLLEHDRIILEFPLYWYSCPAMLKEWIDKVIAYGFAYGPDGFKLEGKDFRLVVTVGSPEYAYQAGAYNSYTISEYLRPFQSIAVFTHMQFYATFVSYAAMKKSDEALTEDARKYHAMLLSDDWSTSMTKFLAE